MEWWIAIVLMLAIPIVTAVMWGPMALVIGAIARELYRRGKSPWRDIDRDAERLPLADASGR